MTLFYLYNPKQYADATWDAVSDAIKKRRLPEKTEIAGVALSDQHTEELDNRIRQYNETAARIAAIENMARVEATIRELEKLSLARMALAQLILEMEEEEGVLLLLLLN